jgi:uncharacterized protein (TIGR00255 family)
MASSMTGLGIGETTKKGKTVVVEIKSVNNRFLEISSRLPNHLTKYEQDLRDIIKKYIKRGKLYVSISFQCAEDEIIGIHVDPKATNAIRNLLENLKKTTGIDEPIQLDHYLKFSEIFGVSKDSNGSTEDWTLVKSALILALKNLKNMRQIEGKELIQDITKRIHFLERQIPKIEKLMKSSLHDVFKQMNERITQLIQDQDVDQDRLMTEIGLMASKIDITEECVRLKSHHQLFRDTMKEEEIGKKLNFLLQEMNREVNTISSKACNAAISHRVVKMKGEIEKLREQVQNLE